MKKLKTIVLACLCLTSIDLSAQQMPGKQPTTINKSNTNPFQQSGPANQDNQAAPHRVLPKKERLTNSFTTPHTIAGIVGQAGGAWVASDHLYNLKPNMSVYLEIIYPEGKNFQINEGALKLQVENLFKVAGITTPAMHAPDEPSLPLFNILISVNAIDQFVFANVECRLFESILLKRVILDPGITFQAITWQQEELIGATKSDFEAILSQSVIDLTNQFIERFNHFLNIRSRLEG